MTYTFYLGLVRSPEHEQKLIELAYWLDQNKFSTTLFWALCEAQSTSKS